MYRGPLFSFALVFLAAVPAVACEDNPDQIYRRAPPGAGRLWNDGKTPASYDRDARNGFADSFNAATKQEKCSGPEKARAWAKMVNQPIVPPRSFAGLDLAGGDGWTGLDLRDAEKVNCQSQADGADEERVTAHWGDSGEVTFTYVIATNTLEEVDLKQGYRGKLQFHSRDNAHTYEWGVGVQVKKDGSPWDINWLDLATRRAQATEMYDALMATYAPLLPGNTTDCMGPGLCAAGVQGAEAYFGARPLGIYFQVPNVVQGQPMASGHSHPVQRRARHLPSCRDGELLGFEHRSRHLL